jgi:hypothetical protein
MAVTENEGGGPSDTYLIDSLIDRWIRHLLYSADHGVAWLSSDGDGAYVEAFVPRLAAVSSFASDAIGQYSLVVPLGESSLRGAVPFDPTKESHVLRMVPRVPALPEVTNLNPAAQIALFRSATLAYRVLRDSSVFNTPLMRAVCRERFEEHALLSTRVLGQDDPTTIYIDLTSCRANLAEQRDVRDFADRAGISDRVLARVAGTRAAWATGYLTAGEWAEQVNDFSVTVNSIWQDLAEAGDSATATGLREQVADDWRTALEAIGLTAEPTIDELKNYSGQVSGLLHNYIGFKLRAPELDGRRWALRVGRQVLLPQRREVAEHRRNDTAVRTSLQVLLRGACLTLPMLHDEAECESLLGDIAAWRNELAGTALIEALERDRTGPYRSGQLNCLETVALAELELAEHDRLDDRDALGDPIALLERVVLEVNGVKSLDELTTTSARAQRVRATIARFRSGNLALDADS